MTEGKIIVGTKLYRDKLDLDTASGFVEVVVSKVGRKYFYVHGSNNNFDLQKLGYTDPGYSQCSFQLYRTLQEITDLAERAKLIRNIKNLFASYDYKYENITLEQLRLVASILNLDKAKLNYEQRTSKT